jgi:predicted dehydrogenase
MNTLRVGVIGGGHLGAIHARLLRDVEGVRLIAIAEADAATRQQLAADHDVPIVADWRELLGRIDAAVLAVPTTLHYAIGSHLLKRDIHLLVEKPLASNWEGAAGMVQLAQRRGLVLQVGHVEQFNPVLRAVREQLDTPRMIEAVREGPLTFRSLDVGVVFDLMIHDVDLALTLVGAEVESVEADGFRWTGDREDVAVARLTFANGCVAHLTASRVAPQPQRVTRLYGDQWQACLDFAARRATIVRAARAHNWQTQRPAPAERARMQEALFTDLLPKTEIKAGEANPIRDELYDFAESIRQGRPPRVPGTQGMAAIAVCQRIVDQILDDSVDARRPAAWPATHRKAG